MVTTGFVVLALPPHQLRHIKKRYLRWNASLPSLYVMSEASTTSSMRSESMWTDEHGLSGVITLSSAFGTAIQFGEPRSYY